MPLFSSQLSQRIEKWPTWRAAWASRQFFPQSEESDQFWTCWGYDGPEVHMAYLWKDDPPPETLITPAENAAWRAEFLALAGHFNKSIVPRGNGGIEPSIGGLSSDGKFNRVSANLCNRSTWIDGAAPVSGELLPAGATVAQLGHPFVIDVTHGQVSGEQTMRATYALKILRSDGTPLQERRFHYQNLVILGLLPPQDEPPYDYEADYATGLVTFQAPTPAGLSASYWYAGSSVSVFPAPAGYEWQIVRVEIQFTTDVNMLDAVVFQAYAGAPGGKFPADTPIVYETLWDLHAEANKAYPLIPPIGSPQNLRGQRGQPILNMDWEYASVTPLRSDMGVELHISMEHDQAFSGTYATATVYGLLRPL